MTLSTQDLSFVRGSSRLLHGVDAEFRSGDVTAICGPNGAGKSTLLTLLAGLERPSEGSVLLDNQPLDELSGREIARAIAFVPQSPDIAWDIPVHRLVALGRTAWGGHGKAEIDEAMRAMEIEEFADRRVLTLSGGERARVLLARALAGRPRYLLVDEPLAALDLGHQRSVMQRLIEVAKSGTAVVIVLHDLAMAYNHADRAIVLDRGHSVAAGPPHEALSEQAVNSVWNVVPRWIGEDKNRALVLE